MERREFENIAKRAYAIDFLRDEWNIKEHDALERVFEEIQDEFAKFFKYETKYSIYLNGSKITVQDDDDDPYYYICEYIRREITAKVDVIWNDKVDFDEWYNHFKGE